MPRDKSLTKTGTRARSQPGIARVFAFSPGVFCLHFAEEFAGFTRWFNQHVEPDITQSTFIAINVFVFTSTTLLSFWFWAEPSFVSSFLAVTWLSFMMFANGVVHILASMLEGVYVPGLVTAALLYIPYFIYLLVRLGRVRLISRPQMLMAVALGSSIMFLQAYRVLVVGNSLW